MCEDLINQVRASGMRDMQAGMNFDAEGAQAAAAFVLCSSASPLSLSLSKSVSHLSSCGLSLANDDAFSRGRRDLKARRDHSR